MPENRRKTVLFAFRGNAMCFIHVLLNALDLHSRGREGKIVIEGEAVTLIATMAKEGHILNPLYRKARELDLIAAVCLACASKLGAADTAKAEGLPLLGDMSNHPSMGHYLDQGYEVITF
ncbi:MAG: cytoplasmic protein [Desulfobulbaceae bacterium]|nr:MAG: cytoplasmic protein [Desulfobulbaceae bacterium]